MKEIPASESNFFLLPSMLFCFGSKKTTCDGGVFFSGADVSRFEF